MGFIYEERASDSPYLESISTGRTAGTGTTIRPAECSWHMVFTKVNDRYFPLFVGPLRTSGVVSYTEGVEILWVKFKLGTFMPHLPTRNFLDSETLMPEASSRSFWLKGSAWEVPTYENIETFVERLVRNDILVNDPVVDATLQGKLIETPSRTMRHRFLRSTGLTQTHIYQVERAQRAAAMLREGKPILDTVYDAGYFDQPHLTRALKRWIGHTPAQITRPKP